MNSVQYILMMLALVIMPLFGFGQTMKVVDYATKKPVSGVHIYNVNETKSAITDSVGTADISEFTADELLVFSHTSYTEVLFKKSDLYTSHYTLNLHPKVLSLDEFVVSANKRIQVREEVPNQMVSITAKDIRLDDPQTAADLLLQTGKVFVQKSQMGGGSPMIRGFAANKVLIVVDGVRMNNAIFRGGNLQNVISVDPNMLDKSEVVFGPGSVIYGSDALGGVMDFQTIAPKFSDTGMVMKVNALMRYSSANGEGTPHFDFTIGGKKWSSVTSFTVSSFSSLNMGKNGPEEYLRKDYVKTANGIDDKMVVNDSPRTQFPSGYKSGTLLQKIGFKASDRFQLQYSFIFSTTNNIPRYDRLIQRENEQTLKYAVWEYGPQKWMMNNISAKINSPNKVFDNLNITLAHQKFEESRIDRKFKDPTQRTRTETVNMFSANFDFDNDISGRTTIFYGLESVYNLVDSKGFSEEVNDNLAGTTPIQTRYPDGSKYWSNAGYINFKVNQSVRNTFVFGLRYNHVNITADFDTTFYNNPEFVSVKQSTGALTGSIGVAFRPTDKWQLNANASSGFKAPNIDDIAKIFDSEPGNVIIPNPDLKPEYLYSVDALISRRFGEKNQHRVEISGFYSFLVDAMVRRNVQVNGQDSIFYDGDLSQAQSLVNTGSANLAGASLIFESSINKHWKITAGGTYTYGKDDEGFYLRHISPFFANAHVIYTYKKFRVNAYVIYNGSVPNSRMSLDERNKPHIYLKDENGNLYSPQWYTVNLKSAYSITKNIMVTFGIENITNQRYRSFSSGIAAPGINFIGSIKATF